MKLLIFLTTLLLSAAAYACPGKDSLQDFNCDGEVVLTIIGDSLVVGTGDTKNNNRGGYVLRTESKLPHVQINNQGVAGLKTGQLVLRLNRTFNSDRYHDLKEALLKSDIVILDLGRNDRWLFGLPSEAFRNLKRISSKIKNEVLKLNDSAPIVVKAVLMLPNRGSQGPWVKELNSIILKSSSTAEPADLRFDLVSKRLLSSDQIHPTPEGYSKLAQTFVSYLKKNLRAKMLKLRPDLDADGIPDLFEEGRYGTDANLADTDSDGVSDGDEVFNFKTDPLTP